MKMETAPSLPVSIFIAGDYARVIEACRAYCDQKSWCVTVTPTVYTYKGGTESGVIVGLINYPRFPANAYELESVAKELAAYLRVELGQQSYSIQMPHKTLWFSHREEDEGSPS